MVFSHGPRNRISGLMKELVPSRRSETWNALTRKVRQNPRAQHQGHSLEHLQRQRRRKKPAAAPSCCAADSGIFRRTPSLRRFETPRERCTTAFALVAGGDFLRIRHQPPLGVGRRRQRRPLAARPTSGLHQQRGTHPTMTEFCGVLSRRSRLNFNSTNPGGVRGGGRHPRYAAPQGLLRLRRSGDRAAGILRDALGDRGLHPADLGLLFLYTLARLPPSRPRCASQLMDSYLRDDFPLNASSHRAIPDVALPKAIDHRISPCGLNATSRIRSRRCARG